MITTISAVIIVSRRVGQTIFAASVRTWLRNWAGLTLAMARLVLRCRAFPDSRPRPEGPDRRLADACE